MLILPGDDVRLQDAIRLLELQYQSFVQAKPLTDKTKHPVPSDTRAWSQILVSTLTGIDGLARKKGADLSDESDVKAANLWSAIDTPRFNGAIPAGRVSEKAKKAANFSALNYTPNIFFVLWDTTPEQNEPRCRVWCVRAAHDVVFRGICAKWYKQRAKGKIRSSNFQLHPPRNRDDNVFRNRCGNLTYPLLFCAVRRPAGFEMEHYDLSVVTTGVCSEES